MIRPKTGGAPGPKAASDGTASTEPIDTERDEILRLIATLKERRQRATPREATPKAQSAGSTRRSLVERIVGGRRKATRATRRSPEPGDERLDKVRRELEEIRALRKRLEERGPGNDLLSIVRGLEQRLDTVEARSGSASPAPASPSTDEPEYTFRGVIQGELLSDMLQLVSSNALTGIFTVIGTEAEHVLYFDEGQLCHAEGGGLSGEPAFFAAFSNQEGQYTFLESTESPSERTINANTQFLILEALRQLDEGGAGESD